MIKFKLLDERCKPHVGSEGAAASDLKVYLYSRDESKMVSIKAGETMVLGTGVHASIPEGWVGLVVPRSSTGKLQVKLENTLGVIDSDYRGEIKLRIFNFGTEEQALSNFDRIVQFMVVPHYNPNCFEIVDSLDDTIRGEQGFGHSGTR